jgi:hypothetical protein
VEPRSVRAKQPLTKIICAEDFVRILTRLARYARWRYWLRRLRESYNKLPLRPEVVCREILTTDLKEVIKLLSRGFDNPRRYWIEAIRILSEHSPPSGLPQFGYILESNGFPVGVLLMIFSARLDVDGTMSIRCNSSSLYIEPAFRSYWSLFVRRAERQKNITYLNISPSRHTWSMVEALGYKRFSNGIFICVPMLSKPLSSLQIRGATTGTCRDRRLHPFETDLLLAHANYGCICVICDLEGNLYPFVFRLGWKLGLPLTHLIYCRDQKDFVCLAGPLGRYLGKRGLPLVVLDSNGPVRGLTGKYLEIEPRYAKGPETPRLGDLAYTEMAMFGF